MHSPLATLPFESRLPHVPDYRSIPVSAKRKRKIAHVQRMLKSQSRARVLDHAIHNMRMHGNDIVEAMRE